MLIGVEVNNCGPALYISNTAVLSSIACLIITPLSHFSQQFSTHNVATVRRFLGW